MGTHPIFESDFDCLTEQMELECFTLLDPDTLYLYLSARFRKARPVIRPPKLHNLYAAETALPLLTECQTGQPVTASTVDIEQSNLVEQRVRSILGSNLTLYIKNSLYSEEGNLWRHIAADDIYANVGLVRRMIAEHKLVKKSILVDSGEISGENSVEQFRTQLDAACLADLATLETIIKETKTASGDYMGNQPCALDALLGSFLVPLSLERETPVSAFIRESAVMCPYVRRFKYDFLEEHGLFVDTEAETETSRTNWRRAAQAIMILGVVTMVIVPRIK